MVNAEADLLLSGDAAKLLGVSAARVRQLAARGALKTIRVGARGTRLFSRVSVERFATARQAARGSQ